jgi:hypothetical protein
MKKKYYLYALIKCGKAVYIGVTKDTLRRRTQHRKDKDFDNLIVLQQYTNKKECLAGERAVISFLTYFGDGNWYNSECIFKAIDRDLNIRKEADNGRR